VRLEKGTKQQKAAGSRFKVIKKFAESQMSQSARWKSRCLELLSGVGAEY